MKTKYTPGPWFAAGLSIDARRSYNTEFCGRLRDFLNPVAVAVGDPMSQDAEIVDGERVPGAEEAEANARLIAAAPELLDALRIAADALEEAAKSFRLNNPLAWRPNLFDLRADAARAAIAKAEGEA